MTSLVDRKVIVIGGSSGIGLGVAEAALNCGAKVVIVSRSPAKLQAAERTLNAGHVTSLVADMTDEADVARLFEEIGPFDHLVSTAGTLPPGDPIGSTDMEAVRGFVDNKLIGAVMLSKHAVRTLKAVAP